VKNKKNRVERKTEDTGLIFQVQVTILVSHISPEVSLLLSSGPLSQCTSCLSYGASSTSTSPCPLAQLTYLEYREQIFNFDTNCTLRI